MEAVFVLANIVDGKCFTRPICDGGLLFPEHSFGTNERNLDSELCDGGLLFPEHSFGTNERNLDSELCDGGSLFTCEDNNLL